MYHVHTTRSDGRGDDAEIARAAKAAGLDFVVVTDHDHGDAGGSAPTPAQSRDAHYLDGVLFVYGAERSTPSGHLVVLPGGLSIAAHPTHPRRPWIRWPLDAGVAGLEILSGDSLFAAALAPPWARLVPAALAWPLAPDAALLSLYDRPDAALARLDATAEERPILALCASDAHGLPDYRHVFGQFVLHAPESVRAPADAAEAGRRLVRAIAEGETWCAVEELGDARGFVFRHDGGRLSAELPGAPPDASMRLVCAGHETALAPATRGLSIVYGDASGGLLRGARACRVEVWRRAPALLSGERELPWIFSGPARLH